MNIMVKVSSLIICLWIFGLLDTVQASKSTFPEEKPGRHLALPKQSRSSRLVSNLTKQTRRRYLKGPKRTMVRSTTYNIPVSQSVDDVTPLPDNKKPQVNLQKFTIDDVPIMIYRGPDRPREIYRPSQTRKRNAISARANRRRSQNHTGSAKIDAERQGSPNAAASSSVYTPIYYGTPSSNVGYPNRQPSLQNEASRVARVKNASQGLDKGIYDDISMLQEHKGKAETRTSQRYRSTSTAAYRNVAPKLNYEIQPGGVYDDGHDQPAPSNLYPTPAPNPTQLDWRQDPKYRASALTRSFYETPVQNDPVRSPSDQYPPKNCSRDVAETHEERLEAPDNENYDYDESHGYNTLKLKRENSYAKVHEDDGTGLYNQPYGLENFKMNNKNGRYERPTNFRTAAESDKQEPTTPYPNVPRGGKPTRSRNINTSARFSNSNGYRSRLPIKHFPARSSPPSRRRNNPKRNYKSNQNPVITINSEMAPTDNGAYSHQSPTPRFSTNSRPRTEEQNYQDGYATTAAIENTYANIELQRVHTPSNTRSAPEYYRVSESADDRVYDASNDQYTDFADDGQRERFQSQTYDDEVDYAV